MSDSHDTATRVHRRDALKLGLAAALGAAAGAGTPARASAPSITPAARRPKNIIFMVSDGMSAGVPSLAESFSHLVRGRGTVWHRLAGETGTAHGFFDMASLDSAVTDSAAASSSWATGTRVANGFLNYLPDLTPLTPIGRLVAESGRAYGFATTTTAAHATPAGFTVASPSRENMDDIAALYLDGPATVMLGGGIENFSAADRKDKRDLAAEFRAKGHTFITDKAGLAQAGGPGKKIMGSFYRGHLPYSIDHRREPALQASVPTLAEMTRAALDTLAGHPAGFLLQIEGGRVDHAAHNNDAAALLWDQLAFDDAVAIALEFARAREDTLVIITSDHGNANPGITGTGRRYALSNEQFHNIRQIGGSFEQISLDLKAASRDTAPTAALLSQIVARHTGVQLAADDAERLLAAKARKKTGEISMHQNSFSGLLGQIVGNTISVAWAGTQHTSDWTPLMAVGPGADRFAALLPNTAAFGHLCDLFGIRHKNPSMDYETAKPHLEKMLESDRIHWEQTKPRG